jgi:uncharacterized protein (DUF1501 family)
MFEAVKMLHSANPQRYRSEHGADYPRSPFGQRLREIAQLIKAGMGLEIAFADVGGWDTHVNQGGGTGQLAARCALRRQHRRLRHRQGDRMDDVAILTMSNSDAWRAEQDGWHRPRVCRRVFVSVRGAGAHGAALAGLEREQL